MKKSSLFKRFGNLEGELYTVQHPPSTLNPSRWVLYSIFMQSWVLWEEPELAVDSERSWSSGNRDPVDAICPIIFISFGQRWVPPRPRTQTKTTLPIKYKCLCLTLFLNFDLSGDSNQTVFLSTLMYFLLLRTWFTWQYSHKKSKQWQWTYLNQTETKSSPKRLLECVLQLVKQQ